MSGAHDLLGKAKTEKLLSFVTELRNAYKREEIEVFISPRDIANLMRVYLYTADLTEAVRITVAPRGTEAERKAITDMAVLHFGKAKTASKALV